MKEKNSDDDDAWLKNDEEVMDYIVSIGGLYEGEGLEEAFKAWKALPKKERTEPALINICKSIETIEFDKYDPPDWIPNL